MILRPGARGIGIHLRSLVAGLAILVLLASALGCAGWFNSESVELTFENRTDATLCIYPTLPDALGGRCLTQLDPGEEHESKHGCGDSANADKNPKTIVITLRDTDETIYTRTDECRAWQQSDRTLIIEQSTDGFHVSGGP